MTGTYLCVLISCAMIGCPVPKELAWIARKEDALHAYMQKFIEEMNSYDISATYTPTTEAGIFLTAGIPAKNHTKGIYEVPYTIGGTENVIPDTDMYVRMDTNYSPFGNLKIVNSSTGSQCRQLNANQGNCEHYNDERLPF